jgi:DNA-binding NarL/FixJ family response regulator
MMSAAGTISVVIVEDDRTTRQGLGRLIGSTEGFTCAGQYSSVEEALEQQTGAPDVLLLDIHLPGMLGSEGVRVFRERFPGLQVVMLTVFDDADRVFESICNGACGYLLKKTPPARLIDAIREAHQGGAPMTPEIARQVLTLFRRTAPPPKAEHGLSTREMDVLRLLADGFGYINIGAQLAISVNTVRNHVRSIYDKLHVHTAQEAVSKALRNRII